MKIKLISIIFFALLMLAGCRHTQTVTKSELETAQAHWQEPKVTRWYYMGTKEGCDYFIHIDLNEETIYRVPSAEMKIENPMQYNSNWKGWRFMHWGLEYQKFNEQTQPSNSADQQATPASR
jgi:hypothetical protein